MKKFIYPTIMLCATLLAYGSASADDINAIAAKVSEYIDTGNYPKALEELSWYQKEVEKLHFAKIVKFFKEDLEGYKRPTQPKTQSAVGLNTVETTYRKENAQINVMLTGSNSGTAGAMGGLAAFGHLAALQGATSGYDTFRLKGFTATLNHQRRRPELSLFLDGGWSLKFIAPDASSARSFADAFPIVELNEYLKGNN